VNSQFQQQLQYSPTISQSARSSPPEKSHHRHTSSTSSIHSGSKDIFMNDHSTTNDHHQSSSYSSPSMTPSNFIRVHFPNKHTTAVSFKKKRIPLWINWIFCNLACSEK
jgi:hypothetical protein